MKTICHIACYCLLPRTLMRLSTGVTKIFESLILKLVWVAFICVFTNMSPNFQLAERPGRSIEQTKEAKKQTEGEKKSAAEESSKEMSAAEEATAEKVTQRV